MKIKNNVLIKIAAGDIKPDGTFTISKGITEIGDYAFWGCYCLKKITFPKSVTKIGKRAFENCENLEEVNISPNITEIGDYAFTACTSLKEIEIPEGVTKVGEKAFRNCESLEEIVFSKNTTEIGNCACENCKSSKKIIIPSSTLKLSASTFNRCNSLKELTIGKIDVLKLYESSKREIDGLNFKIYNKAYTASFATLNVFCITDGKNSFSCTCEKGTLKIKNATPEAEKYGKTVLVPLFLQIQEKRNVI